MYIHIHTQTYKSYKGYMHYFFYNYSFIFKISIEADQEEKGLCFREWKHFEDTLRQSTTRVFLLC